VIGSTAELQRWVTNTRARAAQRRFLAAYKEIGMVTEAAREVASRL
jgi:hypothetical protein